MEYNALGGKNLKPVLDMRDLLLSRADSAADQVAFQFRTAANAIQTKTFSNFHEEVVAIASTLLQKGYREKHIAILSGNTYE